MKKISHRITALAAAAVTLLSASGIQASAYEVTHGNFQKLTQNFHGAGAGYCWGTKEQQDALPQFTPRFLSPAQAVIARFQPGQFYATHMFCTFDEAIISRDILKDPVKAEAARRQIDKLSVKRQGGTPFGLKLEYEGHGRNNGLSSFGLRLMTSYDLNFYLYDRMHVETDYQEYDFMGEDVIDLDDPTGAYSGRIYFDDLYIAGMRVSSSDPYTKFGEPVITWEYGEPTVYVPFSGMIPTPDHPVFEGVYENIMTREEYDLYFDFLRPNGERYDGDIGGSAEILTDLTISYNYGSYVESEKMTYTTNDHVKVLIAPQLTSCH